MPNFTSPNLRDQRAKNWVWCKSWLMTAGGFHDLLILWEPSWLGALIPLVLCSFLVYALIFWFAKADGPFPSNSYPHVPTGSHLFCFVSCTAKYPSSPEVCGCSISGCARLRKGTRRTYFPHSNSLWYVIFDALIVCNLNHLPPKWFCRIWL